MKTQHEYIEDAGGYLKLALSHTGDNLNGYATAALASIKMAEWLERHTPE